MLRRRTDIALDALDYKNPDILKKFVTVALDRNVLLDRIVGFLAAKCLELRDKRGA